jgi:D-3-phosphoglycerate dehydrogenase
MTSNEITQWLIKHNPDIIIAGTEKYDINNLDFAPNLKMISRVGIGLDSVDLKECKKRNIIVYNTPDAPTNAVAELTIGQMFNALRKLSVVHETMVNGGWDRFIGRDINQCVVGVIGCGRIGTLVIDKLQSLNPKKIMVNDIDTETYDTSKYKYQIATKEKILSDCDIITIHIPLHQENINYIDYNDLIKIKNNGIIINTSRGGVINENDLLKWLTKNPDNIGVVDVFEEEPYNGKFDELSNIILSPHLGSCTKKSRMLMEENSLNNVLKFLNNGK